MFTITTTTTARNEFDFTITANHSGAAYSGHLSAGPGVTYTTQEELNKSILYCVGEDIYMATQDSPASDVRTLVQYLYANFGEGGASAYDSAVQLNRVAQWAGELTDQERAQFN